MKTVDDILKEYHNFVPQQTLKFFPEPVDNYRYNDHYFTFSMEGCELIITHKNLDYDLFETLTTKFDIDIRDVFNFKDGIENAIDKTISDIGVFKSSNDCTMFKHALTCYISYKLCNNFNFYYNYEEGYSTNQQNDIAKKREEFDRWGIDSSVAIRLCDFREEQKDILVNISIYPMLQYDYACALIRLNYKYFNDGSDIKNLDLEILYDNNRLYNLAVNIVEFVYKQLPNGMNSSNVFENIREVYDHLLKVNKLDLLHDNCCSIMYSSNGYPAGAAPFPFDPTLPPGSENDMEPNQ